jgi:transcriptional antiterminator RfaH
MTITNWLLLQVKPRQELRVLENLERQKEECCCPQIHVEKLSRGKRINVKEPFFPGYLFINAQPKLNGLTYTSIRSSRGVSKIVVFGLEPIKIPETPIEKIKLREYAVSTCVNTEGLPQAGDQVDILDGPFKGLQDVYSQTDGQQRSIVLINLLHQQTPASLANTQIIKRA